MTNTLAGQTYVALVARYRGTTDVDRRLNILAELIRRGRGDLATHLNRERVLATRFELGDTGTNLHRRLENLSRWIDSLARLDASTEYAHAELGGNLLHAIRTPESRLTICGLIAHAPAVRTGSALLCGPCIPECAR